MGGPSTACRWPALRTPSRPSRPRPEPPEPRSRRSGAREPARPPLSSQTAPPGRPRSTPGRPL
eukprot:7068468-Heterocapsa_arctica.AAC.1